MGPFRITRPRLLAYVAFEGLLIGGVVYALAVFTVLVRPDSGSDLGKDVASVAAVFCAVLLLIQWASPGDDGNLLRELMVFGTISLALGLSSFASLWLLLRPSQRLPALLLLEAAFVVPIAVAAWRWISSRFSLLNATRERVLILGTGETARRVCRVITRAHAREYGVLGFAAEDPAALGTILAMGARVQTDHASLATFAAHRTDRVIVALDEKRGRLPVRQLMELRLRGIEIEESTSFLERVSGKLAVESMLPSWLIFSEGFKTSALRSVLKRASDLVLSSVLLVLATPLMLVTAILIRLDSSGPALYRQKRMGMDRKEFELLKFRSMHADAERQGPTWAAKGDARVTRVGRILRTLRIDELPQLLNILKGEMSFVGPRPERGYFVRQLEQKIPYYGLRFLVRPGLTGWAQVEFHYGATEEDALEKLKYELYYIKNNNLLLDLWIVLKTVKVVLLGTGAR
jgi:sugar transferase (PEP-CTERM system associated)